MNDSRLAVVYLARKVDGSRWMPRFLASLQANSSGRPYDLIVILKGYESDEIPRYLRGFHAPGLGQVQTLTFDDNRFATEAFFVAAESFDYDVYLFFVSSARILVSGWAAKVVQPLITGQACLVGGSSGLEALDETTPFPNPSIRTTGFAMFRNDWLLLNRGDLSVRKGGNLFEAGPDSMTKQILRQDAAVLLVDRNGAAYPPSRWHESSTFRLNAQEGLLFSDNRTDQYALATNSRRRRLALANWGEAAPIHQVPTPIIYIRRIRAKCERLFWRTFGPRIISR